MASLAARDQENLVHAQQRAAASKPLNQNVRSLQPKTPGQTAFQTPYRGRPDDENTMLTIKAAQNGNAENIPLKTAGKGKQIQLATPAPATLGPRNALAPKTTNAKAKTPAISLAKKQNVSIVPRSGHRPPSIRQAKVNTNETIKLHIPADSNADETPSSPEIEYMPPREIPLPDTDDDFPPLDTSYLDDVNPADLIHDFTVAFLHGPSGPDGLSRFERRERDRIETERVISLREEAEILYRTETAVTTCFCDPECPGDCQVLAEKAKIAEANYKQAVADLLLPHERREKEKQEREKPRTTDTEPKKNRAPSRTGPSEAASRRAASVLSIGSDAEKGSTTANIRNRDYARPWLVGAAKPGVARDAPEGYADRHAAAVAASKSNVGFRKGRVVSAKLKDATSGMSDSGTASQQSPRKSEAQWLAEMWADIELLEGAEETQQQLDKLSAEFGDDSAEQDFELTLPS